MIPRISAVSALAVAVLLSGAACDAVSSEPASPASAAPQRGPLPPAVARQVTQWRQSILEDACSGPRFEASGAPSITPAADFNGDGQTDYVVGVGGLECRMDGERMFSVFSPFVPGALILSSPDGYGLEHFQYGETHEVEVREVDGRPALILSEVGPGAWERPFYSYAWGWNGSVMAGVAFYDQNGRRVNEDGSPWRAASRPAPAASTASTAPSGPRSRFLPLPVGYYAPDGDCGVAPFELQYLGETGIHHSDLVETGCRHVRTRSLGGDRYETTESCPSEEGGDAPMVSVWRVSSDGYLYDAPGATALRYCPVERVPARSRFRG